MTQNRVFFLCSWVMILLSCNTPQRVSVSREFKKTNEFLLDLEMSLRTEIGKSSDDSKKGIFIGLPLPPPTSLLSWDSFNPDERAEIASKIARLYILQAAGQGFHTTISYPIEPKDQYFRFLNRILRMDASRLVRDSIFPFEVVDAVETLITEFKDAKEILNEIMWYKHVQMAQGQKRAYLNFCAENARSCKKLRHEAFCLAKPAECQ